MATTTNPTNFGPLTTTFTPSPDCFQEIWWQHYSTLANLVWGQQCTVISSIAQFGDSPSCYPEGYMNLSRSSSAVNWGTINKVFSPGHICPSGWTSAYSSTYGITNDDGSNYALGAVFVTMGVGDMVSVCCPSGYSFDRTTCESSAMTLGERLSLTLKTSACSTVTISTYTGFIGTEGSIRATMQASPIVLLRNTGASPSSTGGSSSNNSNTGLSTGAKIAIGVCIPVGVMIISAICFIVWHRRRKSQTNAEDAPPVRRMPELSGSGFQAELDSGTRIVLGSARAPLEIAGAQRFEADGTQRLELAGDSVKASVDKDYKPPE